MSALALIQKRASDPTVTPDELQALVESYRREQPAVVARERKLTEWEERFKRDSAPKTIVWRQFKKTKFYEHKVELHSCGGILVPRYSIFEELSGGDYFKEWLFDYNGAHELPFEPNTRYGDRVVACPDCGSISHPRDEDRFTKMPIWFPWGMNSFGLLFGSWDWDVITFEQEAIDWFSASWPLCSEKRFTIGRRCWRDCTNPLPSRWKQIREVDKPPVPHYTPPPKPDRECAACGEMFTPRFHMNRYCSSDCAATAPKLRALEHRQTANFFQMFAVSHAITKTYEQNNN